MLAWDVWVDEESLTFSVNIFKVVPAVVSDLEFRRSKVPVPVPLVLYTEINLKQVKTIQNFSTKPHFKRCELVASVTPQ